MSTRRWPARQAFRTRVSMSATGSVTLIFAGPLPTGLAHAGDFPAQRELTETDATQLELAERAPAAAAPLAAVIAAHLELRLPFDLLNPALLRHAMVSYLGGRDGGFAPEGHAQFPEQRQRPVVTVSAGHEGDVHPVDLLDLVVVDLRENHLLLEPEGVVAAPVEALGRQAAEVAHARHRDRDEPVEELVHPRPAQRDRASNRHALAQVEVRDRLLGPGDERLLTRNGPELGDR